MGFTIQRNVAGQSWQGPGGGAVSPDIDFNFEGYASTTALRNDTENNFQEAVDLNPDQITLATGDGVSDLGLTQSMQYNWTGQADGNPPSPGRRVPFGQQVQEVWWEIYLKWSTNYCLDSGNAPYAHKLIFGQVDDGNFRWEIIWPAATAQTGVCDGGGGPIYNCPGGSATDCFTHMGLDAGAWWDDNWYRMRMHWRSSTDDNTADGEMQFWIDPTSDGGQSAVFREETNLQLTNNNGSGFIPIRALLIGRNRDDIVTDTNHTDYMRFGRVRVWFSDPGWAAQAGG